MSDAASPEDSLTLSDKMAQLKTAFETLERNVAARKRGLEDGLQQVHVYNMHIRRIYTLFLHVYSFESACMEP